MNLGVPLRAAPVRTPLEALTMPARPLTLAACCLLALPTIGAMSGCILTSSSETRTVGTRVAPFSLDQLVADVTTEDEMLAMLGTPSRTMKAEGEGVIYVWEYEKQHHSSGSLIFVFGGSTERSTQESTSVLVRDGRVRSWWAG